MLTTKLLTQLESVKMSGGFILTQQKLSYVVLRAQLALGLL